MVESFFIQRRITCGRPRQNGGAWRLTIGKVRNVTRVLKAMLPYLCKKRVEAEAAVGYLENRITGNEFQEVLEREVISGNRERVGRRVDIPWTRKEGLERATSRATSLPRKRYELTSDEEEDLARQYASGSIGQRRLAIANGLPHHVVRRALVRKGLAAKL
jgi:hypothetical protein